MTENEMAAIAAALWEPGQKCTDCACPLYRHYENWGTKPTHEIEAPDMHLPENLWRAVENLRKRGYVVTLGAVCTLKHERRYTDAVTLFAALVALYKAGHPDKGNS